MRRRPKDEGDPDAEVVNLKYLGIILAQVNKSEEGNH